MITHLLFKNCERVTIMWRSNIAGLLEKYLKYLNITVLVYLSLRRIQKIKYFQF